MDSAAILDSFEENEKFSRLNLRRWTFYKMIEHLTKAQPGYIIETGTSHDRDNWEWQGQSPLIWDWFVKNWGPERVMALSIDITPKCVETAKSQTELVDFICADSVTTLNELAEINSPKILDCRLLYLDSYDWSEEANLESAFHHMAELTAVWSKLPSGCMVVVDDRHGEMKGKHFMVELFMDKLGVKPVFKEYQIGWIKP